MDLQTADELLAGQQLVVLVHLLVPGVVGQVEVGGADHRHGACRHDPEAEWGGHCGQLGPLATEVVTQVVESGDDRRVGLHHRPLELRRERLLGEALQELWASRHAFARGEVHHVELLLDPDPLGARQVARLFGRRRARRPVDSGLACQLDHPPSPRAHGSGSRSVGRNCPNLAHRCVGLVSDR